jgi:hypothetical protein
MTDLLERIEAQTDLALLSLSALYQLRDWFTDPKHWIQEFYFKMQYPDCPRPIGLGATEYWNQAPPAEYVQSTCLLGGVSLVSQGDINLLQALPDVLYEVAFPQGKTTWPLHREMALATWNDRVGRTHADILDLINMAIVHAEAQNA